MDDFLILELGNFDVILGLQWLEKLGEITTNWKIQRMRFHGEHGLVELRGVFSLGKSTETFNQANQIDVNFRKHKHECI